MPASARNSSGALDHRWPTRYPYETSPAFPSGHALNNTVVACLIAYLLLYLTSLLWCNAAKLEA